MKCWQMYSYSIVMNAFQKRFTSGGHADRDMKDSERAEELLSHLVTKSMYEKSGFRASMLLLARSSPCLLRPI